MLPGKSRVVANILVHPHEGLLLPLIGIPTKQRFCFSIRFSRFLLVSSLYHWLQSSCISNMKFLLLWGVLLLPMLLLWAVKHHTQLPNDSKCWDVCSFANQDASHHQDDKMLFQVTRNPKLIKPSVATMASWVRGYYAPFGHYQATAWWWKVGNPGVMWAVFKTLVARDVLLVLRKGTITPS